MIAIQVQLFAQLREDLGTSTLVLDLSGPTTAGELLAELARQHPECRHIVSLCRVAVNQEFAEDSQPLQADDEIAIIPPVSGG